MLTDVIPSALLSGFFAGIVAALVSIGIEKFGGAFGGILGSSPTTLMPAAIGLWITITQDYNQSSLLRFQNSMLIICPSLLITGLFLYCWKILPGMFEKRYLSLSKKSGLLLILVSISSYGLWFLGATIFVLITRLISQPYDGPDTILKVSLIITEKSQNGIFFLALVGLVTHFAWGIIGSWNIQQTPKSNTSVPLWSNALRGLAAGISIFLCVLLGKLDPLVGGVLSMVPAIFGTAMVSVWITSGRKVSLGAIEPLVLGCSSVNLYAFNLAFILPYFSSFLKQSYAIALSIILCYMISICFVCIPCHYYLQWRQRINLPRQEEEVIIVLE
jgi:hypothetical protein